MRLRLFAPCLLSLAVLPASAEDAIADRILTGGRIGSLEPGKRADIAVWDTDFYMAPTAAIKDAKCLMTLLDGEVVFGAASDLKGTFTFNGIAP